MRVSWTIKCFIEAALFVRISWTIKCFMEAAVFVRISWTIKCFMEAALSCPMSANFSSDFPAPKSVLHREKFRSHRLLFIEHYFKFEHTRNMSTPHVSFPCLNVRNLKYFVFMLIFYDNSESSSAKLRIIKRFYSAIILSHARLK